ncbi:MAG: extracellular solute-binding protein [Christensenellales bacterium]|jgi:putative aldouronate transport system substrate-binding protein
MQIKTQRKSAMAIALLLLVSMLVGACTTTDSPSVGSSTPPAAQAAATPAATSGTQIAQAGETSDGQADAFTYPMEPVTLTINTDPVDMSTVPEWAQEHYFWTELQNRTGVTLEHIGGASNPMAASEQFILLLASMDYPDILQANWLNFPGGPTTAINEGYIIPFDGYEEHYPNFLLALEKEPKIRSDISTDDGQLYCFPYIAEIGGMNYTGMVVRKDWLDQVGMEVPVTMSELYNALVAFKNEIGAPAPLTFEYRWLFLEYAASTLSSPYEVCYPYFVMDEQVKYGPLEPAYKDFLMEMNRWYAEGLIDRDMPSINKASVEAKLSSGDSGMAIIQAGNLLNILLATADDASFEINAVPTPVLNAGDDRNFGQLNNSYSGAFPFAISSQCKEIEKAFRFCDYSWGDEGQMLNAYGTEGVSYELEGDKVVAGGYMLDNPDGMDARAVRSLFGRVSNFPYRGLDHDFAYPDALMEIKVVWAQNNMEKLILPPITHTSTEATYITSKANDLDTYCREMVVKFIIGTENFANYDNFLSTLESYGASQVLEFKQIAYERYLTR